MSHSGKRLNDAWLGLLVSIPHNRGNGRGREGWGGEREKRNGRLGQQDVSAMRVRQIHAPDCNSSAVLLTPVTRLGGRGTEANSKQRLWCKCFGQAEIQTSQGHDRTNGLQRRPGHKEESATQAVIARAGGVRHEYVKAWRT